MIELTHNWKIALVWDADTHRKWWKIRYKVATILPFLGVQKQDVWRIFAQ